VLLDTPHGGQIAFFEIAATLIPILVFSGVVAERHGPQARDSFGRTGAFAFLIPLFGATAIMAELTSINAVIMGRGSGLMVGFVATALALGLVGVVLMVWLPWLAALKKRMPAMYRVTLWGCCATLALVGVEAIYLIVDSVGSADKVERVESLAKRFERESDAVNADLERNINENDSLQLQLRLDARASAQASERLIRAQAEHAPKVVIKSLTARLKQELEFTTLDAKRAVQLSEEAERLFKKQTRLYEELAPKIDG
jgi:hypothetical protein